MPSAVATSRKPYICVESHTKESSVAEKLVSGIETRCPKPRHYSHGVEGTISRLALVFQAHQRMFQIPDIAIDHLKDVPGFKGLLKVVIKSQIQLLLEQLAKHTDEESIILSASVSDGGFSHMASDTAKDFLCDKEELKSQFLRHCLKVHHKHQNPIQQDEESEFPVFGQDVRHMSFLKRKKKVSDEDLEHQLSSGSQERPKMGHHFPNSKVFRPNEVSKRKRLKTTQSGNYHPVPQSHLDIQPSYSIFSATPNEHNGNVTTEPSKQKFANENFEEPTALKIVKVEIDLETDSEEGAVSFEETGDLDKHQVLDPGDDTSGKMFENLKQFNDPSTGMPHSGHIDNGDDVVDLSLSAANSSFSGNSETNNLYAPQLFTQVLTPSEESQGFFHSQGTEFYNSLEMGKLPKKRVYRKVECDVCHKMIYITNIKVHKFRHTQQIERMKVTKSLSVSALFNAVDM